MCARARGSPGVARVEVRFTYLFRHNEFHAWSAANHAKVITGTQITGRARVRLAARAKSAGNNPFLFLLIWFAKMFNILSPELYLIVWKFRYLISKFLHSLARLKFIQLNTLPCIYTGNSIDEKKIEKI